MNRTPTAAFFAALVVVSVATVVSVPVGAVSGTDCKLVRHDAFMTETAVEEVNQTGTAASAISNTRAIVTDDTGFIRLHAENPNGYCVKYTVLIHREIVTPAELGEVDSVTGEDTTAQWTAVQNLSTGTLHTEVVFTVSAASNTTFAPNDVRVMSLAWSGKADSTADRVLGDLFGDEKLEQKRYTIDAPNNSSMVTVDLARDGRSIDDWQATYSLNGASHPVSQDPDDAVYYTENGDTVTFHFNDKRATVQFHADPGWFAKASHSWGSWTDGYDRLFKGINLPV